MVLFDVMSTPLNKAIEICGSQTALAKAATEKNPQKQITQSTVGAWVNRFGGRVGDGYVLAVSEAVNWQVTPHDLRPDLYPHPQDGLPPHMREVA